MPRGGASSRGCAAHGGVLGSWLCQEGSGGAAGRRAVRAAQTIEGAAIAASRRHTAPDAARSRTERPDLGWKNTGCLDRQTVWCQLGCAPVPTLVPSAGIPMAQTATRYRTGESRSAAIAQKKLQTLMRDNSVDLWSTDEVHFQQHGSRCRLWVPPEIKDPVLLHAPTRKSVGYFGAVRLRDGRFVFRREEDKFNGISFFRFLRDLRRTAIRTGRRIVVIPDNAKYHHALLHKSWREEQAPGFTLDFLPPYSPEVIPIERVWKLTRRLCLHNRYFGFLDGVVSAVEDQFAEWTKSNDILRRLCAIT